MNGNSNKLVAEAIGTFWLTFGGCGSAVIAAGVPDVGIGMLGVALAFGLTVVTMAYAIGHISGCHLNPAVTVGLACGGRFPTGLILPYVIAQVIGAVVGAAVLYAIASGAPDFSLAGGFAANGYAEHSPGKYGLGACLLSEFVLTMMFLFVIMGATHGKAPVGFAPLAIGLALTLIHLISIHVTNTSVNPARSTGPATSIASSKASLRTTLAGEYSILANRCASLARASVSISSASRPITSPNVAISSSQ